MDYTYEEFERLIEEIERQGGEYLDRMHIPRVDQMVRRKRGSGPEGEVVDEPEVEATGCQQIALFNVPYPRRVGGNDEVLEIGWHEMCAGCDNLGDMPRFASAMEEV